MNFEDYLRTLQTLNYDDVVKLALDENTCHIGFMRKRGMAETIRVIKRDGTFEEYLLNETNLDENIICENIYNSLCNSGLDLKFSVNYGMSLEYQCTVGSAKIVFPNETNNEWVLGKATSHKNQKNI